jgi:hypothetical protein
MVDNPKMEPEIPGEKSGQRQPTVVGAIVAWSMVATLCSAGAAALIFMLLVLPLSDRAWTKAGAQLPAFAQKLLDHRLFIAGGVVGLIALGCFALFGMKRGLPRLAVVAVVLAALIAITASGIIGWWLMFRTLYEEAGADI